MGIKEFFGWICEVIAIICGVIVFIKSARARSHMGLHDRKSILESKFENNSKLSKDPIFVFVVYLGIIFALLGMYLLGMFGE